LSNRKIEKKICNALMGRTTVSLGELYAFALNATVQEIKQAVKESDKVRTEILKALGGMRNNLKETFDEWKYGK